MIAIVDYGVGNVLALQNVYRRLNIPSVIARVPDDLAPATRLILPGVGAFDSVMRQLDASPLRATVETLVRMQGLPVLGICVGMQVLADRSDEGTTAGLGWIAGRVRKFNQAGLALPHMGWNDVNPAAGAEMFRGLESGARFYFLHSYYFECANSSDVAGTTPYGREFACAVQHHNVYGVQFHPEKSHHWGERLLKNFAEV